jgi:hypothetical protein
MNVNAGSSKPDSTTTYPQTELIRKTGKRVLLQERADMLMNEAELLTCANVQQGCQEEHPLFARAVDEVCANLFDIVVIRAFFAAPARARLSWSWRCGGRRRWRR